MIAVFVIHIVMMMKAKMDVIMMSVQSVCKDCRELCWATTMAIDPSPRRVSHSDASFPVYNVVRCYDLIDDHQDVMSVFMFSAIHL